MALAGPIPSIRVSRKIMRLQRRALRQLHIHGANGSAPEHNKRALEYISTGQVPVKDLIKRHVSLGDVLDGFDIAASGEAIKVTVEPK